ncbi:TPA: hypothetical protein ACJGO4_003591 [Salmonella enterica subsp. enterica serovar Java]
MTTITKERIELFIKNPLENGLTRGEQMDLARIALVSLDAEPVRYLNKFSGTCVTLEQQSNAADDVAVYMPLYAAPPVPVQVDIEMLASALKNAPLALSDNQGRPRALVVPPAIEPDYKVIKGILPTANPDEYACCIAADMWNACRADMFQGSQPVSNRDELSSPVIPDGYALVPVEPTPEMREAFHVANEEYESGSYDVWKPDHQWQAMLAAAPQLKIALASIERCQAGFDAKHALFEVAIARFSKMNEGFPIKRFKADWVISWMLENFPPVAQKQGDN